MDGIEYQKKTIRKVKQSVDGWYLVPTDGHSELFISRKYYRGNMPPFFIFPWQTFEIEVEVLQQEVFAAKLNSQDLFCVPNDLLPYAARNEREARQAVLADMNRFCKEEVRRVKTEKQNLKDEYEKYLATYDREIAVNLMRKDLNICLRAPFLMLWHAVDTEERKKICFLAEILKIISQIYHEMFQAHDSKIGVSVTAVNVELYYHMHYSNWQNMNNAAFLYSERKARPIDLYIEQMILKIKEALKALNISEQNSLFRDSLVAEMLRLLDLLVQDYEALWRYAPRDWEERYLYGETKNYVYVQSEMQLARCQSWLMPISFSEEEIHGYLQWLDIGKS